jgi:RHS repeat-associated protein
MLNGGAATTSVYNAANELSTSQTSAGVTTYAFDGDGNLLTSVAPGNQITTNSWDGENRLTRVALPSGVVDTFTYNGDGQRVQKQDSTGTTNHVWDGENILFETTGGNTIQVVYTLEPEVYGNLVSQSRGGSDSFYLFDALGSARQLASSAASVTDTYLYDSFGNVLIESGMTVNPFRYIGRLGYYFDPDTSGFVIRVRMYSAAQARFLSRDPMGRWGGDGNPYRYVENNPLGLIDPTGMQAQIQPSPMTVVPLAGCTADPKHCGRATFPVRFALARNKTGAVIQHLFIDINIWDCDTGRPNPAVSFEYFEAWDAKAADQTPSIHPSANFAGLPQRINDLFVVCGKPNSCGSFSVEARIGHFPGYKIVPCFSPRADPRDCWSTAPRGKGQAVTVEDFCNPRSHTPFAGSLPRREIAGVPAPNPAAPPPGFWNAGMESGLPRHRMLREWNCCKGCGAAPESCPKQGDHCEVVPVFNPMR